MDEIAERFARAFETGQFEAKPQAKSSARFEDHFEQPKAGDAIMKAVLEAAPTHIADDLSKLARIDEMRRQLESKRPWLDAFAKAGSQISNSGEPDAEPPI